MTNLVWQFCAVLQAAATSALAKRSWRGHAFPLVLLLATMVASTAHGQNQSLFVPLPNNQLSDATPAQSTRLQTVRGNPAVVSLDIARVNLDALQGNTVTLALPGGDAVATNRQTIVRGPSDYTWIGDMAAGGQAVLVVRDGEVTGQVQSGLKTYEITPIGGGVHALTQVDQSRFPPDHPHAPPVPPSRGGDTQLAPPAAPAATLAQVDVLIAYTTNAKNAYGGDMPSFAQLSVDTANAAYSASNGGVIMRLVGTIEVTYTETTFDNALNDVTNGTGVMAAVQTKRNQVGADIVSLFINETDFCGVGWLNSPESYAYTTVYWSCAVSNFSFPHEVGHNFGALHDPYVDPTTTPYAWGHGYIKPTWEWRTIMAYVNQCQDVGMVSCPRLGYFSNPNVSYLGSPMGTAATNDVARVHRDRVATVAAFRAPVATRNSHDFDLSGRSDIAFRDTSGNTAIWLMNGIAILNQSSSFVSNVPGQWGIVGQRDFNGDGKADLLWRDTGGNVAIWEMNGTAVLNASSSFVANVPGNWSIVGTGDFNGDGMGDLLWQDTSHNVAIWLMNGTTILNQSSSFVANVPSQWSIKGTGDFNGDGKVDILWLDTSGNVAIWEMNGTAILNQNSSFVSKVGSQWSIKGTGDFNADGKADILWQDSSGNVAIWEMNGTTILNQNSSFVANVPGQWSIQLTGDFNGDGMSDILWQDTSGNVAIWQMNGTTVLNQNSSFVANLPGQWSIQRLAAD
jgi:hypothetical protein